MGESFIPFETHVPAEEEASMELLENIPDGGENQDIIDDQNFRVDLPAENTQDQTDRNSLHDNDKFSSPRRGETAKRSSSDSGKESRGPFIVSLCGLPYSANIEDIEDFMDGCKIVGNRRGIHIANGPDGRPNGIAFVELCSKEDILKAEEKHKNNMGSRYIEVRQVTSGEMQRKMDKWKPRRDPVNAVVLLKGLPFSCTVEDVKDFFRGLDIEPNGIMIVLDGRGRVCGDGFVHFASLRSVDLALQRHKEKIKHRYIEVYRSDLREMYPRVTNQLSPVGPWGNSNRRRDNDYGYRSRAYDDRSYKSGPIRTRGSRYYEDNDRGRYRGPYDRPSPPQRGYHRGYDVSPPRHYIDRSRVPHKEYVPPYRSKTGYSVHMRGLPYTTTKDQILDFFSPVVPVEVNIEMLRDGKRTGNANVDFATEDDVNEALRKDREKIDSRYIELYNNKNRC